MIWREEYNNNTIEKRIGYETAERHQSIGAKSATSWIFFSFLIFSDVRNRDRVRLRVHYDMKQQQQQQQNWVLCLHFIFRMNLARNTHNIILFPIFSFSLLLEFLMRFLLGFSFLFNQSFTCSFSFRLCFVLVACIALDYNPHSDRVALVNDDEVTSCHLNRTDITCNKNFFYLLFIWIKFVICSNTSCYTVWIICKHESSLNWREEIEKKNTNKQTNEKMK